MSLDDVYRKIMAEKLRHIEPTDVIEDADMVSYIVIGADPNKLKVVRIPDYAVMEITDFAMIKNSYRADTTYEPFYFQRAKFDIADFSKYQISDVVIDKSKKTWLVYEVHDDAIIVQKYPTLNKDNTFHTINADEAHLIDSVWEMRR
jgi:hypothetical protein